MAKAGHDPLTRVTMYQYELQEWTNACRCYDSRDYDKALRIFMTIGDNAKMHFNIGVIFSVMQDHHRALAAFKKALKMDPFLAVALFQKGVSHFALGEMEEACQAFDLAQKKLRGNPIINYHQLGLAFRLYECEVLFNRGICHLNMGKIDAGLTDLYFAQKAKMTEEHSVVDQAIRDRGEGYSVYSIPPGVLFRPPEYKVQQLRGGGYTGTAACTGTKRHNNSILVPPIHQHHWTQHLPMIDTTHSKVTTTTTTKNVPATASKARRPKRPPAAPPLFENERDMLQEQQQQKPLSPPLSPPPPPPSKATTKPTEMQGWKFVDQRQQQSNSNPQPSTRRQRSLGNTQNTGWLPPEIEKKLLHDNITSHHLQTPLPIPKVQHNQPDHVNGIDTVSSYGDALDEELEKVYANLDAYLKNDLASDAEQSTISSSSSSNRSTSDSSTRSTQQNTTTNIRKPMHQHNQDNESRSKKEEKNNTSSNATMPSKLKIKAHYHDTRVLVVPGDIQFDDLLARIRVKFDSKQPLRLQYKDEENELVLMIDQDDLAMARHIAQLRSNNKTSPSSSSGGLEKLELWCLA